MELKKKSHRLRLSRGLRKYIRQEKARIRREVLDMEEQRKLVEEIYRRVGREK